jgi:rhomboid protease GluP
MENLKFKLIGVKLIVILFSFVAIYSFLHWLLFIQLRIYEIREIIVVWILPLTLPLVPIWIWLRKRIRLLNLETKKDNLFFNYIFVLHLFVGSVTVATQYFLISFSGELRELKSPSAITEYRRAKYYTISQYYADKSQARRRGFSHTSGKRSQTLHYEYIIAVPLFNKNVDTAGLQERVIKDEEIASHTEKTGTEEVVKISTISDTFESRAPAIWVCLFYKTSLSNSSSLAEKDESWDDFIQECKADLAGKDFFRYTYFEYPGNNSERDKYVKTVAGSNNGAQPYVLMPNTEFYSSRYAEELAVVFGVLIIGGTIILVMVSVRPFDEDALQKFLDDREHVETVTSRGYI